MTRVVIMLAGGDHQFAYFLDRSAANTFIEAWVARHVERINNGQVGQVETSILTGQDIEPGHEDRLAFGALTQYVIGMYVVPDEPTAAERMASVMEKCHREGNEWKGDEE